MMIVPLNFMDRKESVFIVVLESNNLNRMKKGDPVTIESVSKGGIIMPKIKFPENMSVLIAYDDDEDGKLYEAAKRGPVELLRYLEKNREWKPGEDGQDNVITLPKSGK